MKQYNKLLKSVTKNVNIPILQNILCDNGGIHASDRNIFLYIKSDMFSDTKIRDIEGIEQDIPPYDFIVHPEYGVYKSSIQINKKTLLNNIKQLKPYMAKISDYTRDYLKGIHIQFDSDDAAITATDGYKALKINIPEAFTYSQDLNIFIPIKLISVIETLDELGTIDIKIEQYEKVYVIETGNISITYKPSDYFISDIKRIFTDRKVPIDNITLDKHTTLSILKGLKNEINDYIDGDVTTRPSTKKREKQNIIVLWNDNKVFYEYANRYEKIPFTRVIPCVGTIKGKILLDNLILACSSIDANIINIEVYSYSTGLIIISDNIKKIAIMLRRV